MDENVVNAIKNINMRLNHLNDYVVFIMEELDRGGIIGKDEFNKRFDAFIKKSYSVKGNVDVKHYNLEV